MIQRFADISGQKFKRLTVIRDSGKRLNRSVLWECRCDCGTIVYHRLFELHGTRVVSCGCYSREQVIKRSTKHGTITHGVRAPRLYEIWCSMKRRCASKTERNYGAKGIKVCPEWFDWPTFRNWAASNGYANNLSIERLDTSKGYSPDNCTWIPLSQQPANRFNVPKSPSGTPWYQVALANGISIGCYHARIVRGWAHDRAATEPTIRR